MFQGRPSVFHVPLTPYLAKDALSHRLAPVTEVLTAYFPTSYSHDDQQDAEADLKKLVAVIEATAEGYRGSAGGWCTEEMDIPGSDESGKAYITLIGWDSVEAHTSFRSTQSFKDNIHLLRRAKELKKSSVVHVPFVEFETD